MYRDGHSNLCPAKPRALYVPDNPFLAQKYAIKLKMFPKTNNGTISRVLENALVENRFRYFGWNIAKFTYGIRYATCDQVFSTDLVGSVLRSVPLCPLY